MYDQGRGSQVIARHTKEHKHITVVSPLGRPAWRRAIQGRSFRRILEKVETPIIYVPKVKFPIRRILVCLGGLGYASSVRNLSAYIANSFGASVTILHVIEPSNLNYPITQELRAKPENIVNTETPQGRNIKKALMFFNEMGIAVELIVRVGSIVREIQAEIEENDYDLVGLGTHYDAHSLRNLYVPNVTAEVAESVETPIITVRKGCELLSIPSKYSS